MESVTVTVNTERGLHATPAAMLAQLCMKFTSHIRVSTVCAEGNNITINAKNLIGVYALQAKKGTTLHISVEGEDEKEAVEAIVDLVETRNFDGE